MDLNGTTSPALLAQKGILMPVTAISSILNGGHSDEFVKNTKKSQILALLFENKKLYISDICEKLHLEPSETIDLLNELKKDKKITESH